MFTYHIWYSLYLCVEISKYWVPFHFSISIRKDLTAKSNFDGLSWNVLIHTLFSRGILMDMEFFLDGLSLVCSSLPLSLPPSLPSFSLPFYFSTFNMTSYSFLAFMVSDEISTTHVTEDFFLCDEFFFSCCFQDSLSLFLTVWL